MTASASASLTDEEVRAINLIEILMEEAEAEGLQVPEPPADAKKWSEDAIRAYFSSKGTVTGLPQLSRLPSPDLDTFKRWFPGLSMSRTECSAPKLRILCFPNAGNAEDMYTSEGTGPRRAPSPLLEWCRAHDAECLAPQYPGRAMRLKESRVTDAAEMAAKILPVVASRLYDVPWVLIAHSVGTWIGYEFLHACKKAGVPMPKAAFISAMPSPDIPLNKRPWRQQRNLNEADFIDECRGWDISEVVFSTGMWPMYQPLLRADFTIFDEYEFRHAGSPPFTFPAFTYWGTLDRRVKEDHVGGWKKFFSGPFSCEKIEGNHLWPLDKSRKAVWLDKIVTELDTLSYS